MSSERKPCRLALAIGLWPLCGLAGCDPIINIAGANFPAWLLCAIIGAVAVAMMRPILIALRVEPYLWPLPLVYLSLAVLFACIVYVTLFRS